MRIALIVAVSRNGIIGQGGALPWRIPEDMRRFKSLTVGKPCIMGRKTWESFPKRPLPDRPNIVVTRDPTYRAAGGTIVHSFDEGVEAAKRMMPDAEEIMVLGGAEIYAQALSRAQRIYLTRVDASVDGDVRWPELDPTEWFEVSSQSASEPAQYPATFVVLDRRAR